MMVTECPKCRTEIQLILKKAIRSRAKLIYDVEGQLVDIEEELIRERLVIGSLHKHEPDGPGPEYYL